MTDTTAAIVDARGMRCPWPVLRLARALRSSDAVIIVADDPIAPDEIAAFAREQGFAVASVATAIGDGFLVSHAQI